MPNQPLIPAEIEQCKGWLGYPQVLIQANPIIGSSRVFEDILAKYAGDQLIGWIRASFIPQMTQIDADIYAARSRYKADRLEGEVTLNKQEHRALVRLRTWLIGEFAKKSGIKAYQEGASGGGAVY